MNSMFVFARLTARYTVRNVSETELKFNISRIYGNATRMDMTICFTSYGTTETVLLQDYSTRTLIH